MLFLKCEDKSLFSYTVAMLVIVLLFILLKQLIRSGILRRPILRSKALKTVLEFCQAYTSTAALIFGSLCLEDFYNSLDALDSIFEGILFWILIVYQFW